MNCLRGKAGSPTKHCRIHSLIDLIIFWLVDIMLGTPGCYNSKDSIVQSQH